MSDQLPEPENIDHLVDELTEFQQMLAFSRALRTLDIEHDFADYRIIITDERYEDGEALEALRDSEDLFNELGEELKKLAVELLLANMIKEGLIYADGVDHDTGDIIYRVCEDVEP